MEHPYQMHVIPDILRVLFSETVPETPFLMQALRVTTPVETGVFMVNEHAYTNTKASVLTELRPTSQTLHDTRLYSCIPEPSVCTLLMVDPGVCIVICQV